MRVRMVLVPGFTQGVGSWARVVAALDPKVDAVALEVPIGLDFVATAAAIGAAGGPATYVGYSMGGRLSLRLALDRPDLVERLVLVSASPGIAESDARAERRAADERLATEIERDGVDAFLVGWLRQPLFATLAPEDAGLDERRRHCTVASLTHGLRALGPGSQEPLWDRLPDLSVDTLLVAGALDARYTALAGTMSDAIGARTRVEVVAEAGHAVPLERPDAVAHLVTA